MRPFLTGASHQTSIKGPILCREPGIKGSKERWPRWLGTTLSSIGHGRTFTLSDGGWRVGAVEPTNKVMDSHVC